MQENTISAMPAPSWSTREGVNSTSGACAKQQAHGWSGPRRSIALWIAVQDCLTCITHDASTRTGPFDFLPAQPYHRACKNLSSV